MKYRGIFEYEYPTEHKPPVSIDVHLHGDCVKGKIIEWEYRPLKQEPKADLEAILVDLQSEIHELENPYPHDYDNLLLLAQHNAFYDAKSTIEDLVDEKINKLKEAD